MAAVRSPEHKPSESGFRAQLRAANLADLVQMECLSTSRRVIRVTTLGDVGYLFFSGGAIVHASTLEAEGETAALQILKWHHGTFEACSRDFPARPTIAMSAQHLLLRAAQEQDEAAVASGVVNLPAARPLLADASFFSMEQDTMHPPALGDRPEQQGEPLLLLRLDAQGAVIANRGASEEYAQMVAYTCLLADIIGTHLGMDDVRAIECSGPSGKTIIYRDLDEQIVAFKPGRDSSMTALHGRVG